MTNVLRLRPAIATGGLLTAAVVLSACSGSASGGSASESTSPNANRNTVQGGFRPAASGEIAAISGRTLQVQSTTDQTPVTYSAKTKFTTEQQTTFSAVRVGTCIVAMGRDGGSSSSGPARNVTATRIQISQPVHGSCGGRGPVNGAPNGAAPTGVPSGFPSGAVVRGSGLPSGSGSGALRARFANAVAGQVTAISGSVITVKLSFKPPGGTSTTPVSGTVRVTSATTYLTTVATTHAALKVGLCAVVSGTTDSSGAVAATRIQLSPKTNGSCGFVIGGGPNG